MKKWLKRSLALVMSAILIAGLMCTGVSAAEDRPVKVELDGRAVSFTDAEPQVLDGRTYVPFRAVFEALGAEVGFDESARTVSAKRNGTTVIIPIDSHEITVNSNGIVYTDYMDATAYVGETGRTYIPVRYAAEALGCCVGWDADDRTVILVDTQSLVNQAVEKNEFSLLEKYTDYANKFSQGNYEIKMTMDMAATVLATEVMGINCTAEGVMAGGTAGEMSMTMKMDLAGLLELLYKLADADEAMKKEMTDAFAEAGIKDMKMEVSVQVRMDMGKGTMYMNMSGVPGMDAVLPADTWLFIDIGELLDELGGYGVDLLNMDYTSFSLQDFVAPLINEMNYIYDKDSAYDEIKTQVDTIVAAFSDSAFVKNGQSYTNTQKLEEAGLTISFHLDTNAAGEVVGYETGADMTFSLEEMGLDEYDMTAINELGKQLGVTLKPDDLKLSLRSGLNDQNRETLKLELSMGNLVLLTIDADGTYTPTTKLPNTGLPAGAKSVRLEQLLMSQYE